MLPDKSRRIKASGLVELENSSSSPSGSSAKAIPQKSPIVINMITKTNMATVLTFMGYSLAVIGVGGVRSVGDAELQDDTRVVGGASAFRLQGIHITDHLLTAGQRES